MMKEEKFLYHSFPRRGRNTPSEIEKGVTIFKSIAEKGLLLTPEIKEWRELRRDTSGKDRPSEPWRLIQKSISFTMLEPSELIRLNLSESFGHFALEFEIATLRKLGAIPVFYLPKATEEHAGLEWVAACLLARLGEIQILLARLAEIEEGAKKAPVKAEHIPLGKNKYVEKYLRCTYGGAEDLINFLRLPADKSKESAQSISTLSAALRALSGFFYQTEDLTRTDYLYYYQQREWRIIANMMELNQKDSGYIKLTHELKELEKNELIEIDSEFFEVKEQYHTGTYRRVDQCQFFPEFGGKRIIQHARRVIVPEKAIVEISKILEGIAPLEVVALEKL